MRNVLARQTGVADSRAPLFITIIIMAVLAFLAYKFLPIKWRFIKFKDEVQEVLNINYAKEYKDVARGAFNEYTMKEKVLNLAKQHKIPIVDADRQVALEWPNREKFTLTLDYEEIIKLPIYGEYIWKFHIYAEQDPLAGRAMRK
ncbi:hypothetical protein K8T06_14090 [bacterium]|nr:hypothetical protein [bacterium]